MVRKRVWEVGAALGLLLVLLAAGGGAWHFHSLNQALAAALDGDDAEKALQLLQRGARPTVRGSDGRTVLTVAATVGDPDLLASGLTRGVGVDIPDGYGLTPLMWASANGMDRVARDLLAAGADPNLRASSGHSALGLATLVGKATMRTATGINGLSIEKSRAHRSPGERETISVLRRAKAHL
jgi:ankyrin repeat protein